MKTTDNHILMKYFPLTLIFICLTVLLPSCKIYSFSGASISPEIKTVSVDYFTNQATIVNPSLSQELTEALKDKFLTRTSLSLVDSDGDMAFSGVITSYTTTPQAITSDQTAAMNRLSITIRVHYTNDFDEKSNFTKTFTRYQDYDSSLSLSDVEGALVNEIVSQLVDDLFNETAVNW